jgi:hypothetical protein
MRDSRRPEIVYNPAGITHLMASAALVRLSYLAPGLIRALLAGRHPIALTPTRLLRLSKDLPHDWQEQRQFLGCAA